ncbi:MAG TPA: diguanylate cyclase [Thermoanaerobaculia bacterium]|nr:diguanylate cyclase [Thermoanaerobaculia bacterium]
MPTFDHALIGKYLDLLLDAVCVVDAEARLLFVSAAGERIFGYPPDEMLGRPILDFVHPDDRAATLEGVDEIMAGRARNDIRNRYVRKDGRVVHVMWSARWSESDQVRIAVARDVTALVQAEALQAAVYAVSEAAHTAEDLLALFGDIHRIVGELLPAENFFVALHDAETDTLSFPYFVDENDPPPAPCSLEFGSLTAEVIRSGEALLVVAETAAGQPEARGLGSELQDWLGVPLGTSAGVLGALVVQSYSGEVRYTESDKELLQYVSVQVANAILRKQAETRLQRLSLHDPLTDLPNRVLLHDRIETALARARRDRSRLAVLFVDLDDFKEVNDRFGHEAGDRVLTEVAARLVGCLRSGDTVSRLGGDEFVVLLSHLTLPEHAANVAAKIRRVLVEPHELEDHRLRLTASIGIAVRPEHGDALEPLMQRADEAMYRAKRAGGDRWEMAPTLVVEDAEGAP